MGTKLFIIMSGETEDGTGQPKFDKIVYDPVVARQIHHANEHNPYSVGKIYYLTDSEMTLVDFTFNWSKV